MGISEKLIDEAPGLLGRLARFINESSTYKHPELSLASAFSILSALKAHRVRTESNLRTNLLIIGLASSGEGKGHGLKMIESILTATGHKYLLSGRPASDVGMLKSLASTGKKIIPWDEFGLYLKKMTNKNSPGYYGNILSIFMDTFSAADGLYRGFEYADQDGKRPRIDIKEPCLCLYGVSAPVRFFQALNSDFAIDGFLPRLLIFKANETKNKKAPLISEVQKKIELDQKLLEEIQDTFPVGELSHLNVSEPKVVEMEEGAALNAMWAINDMYFDKKNKTSVESEKAVYSRALEHFLKLCLVCEDFDSPKIKIDTAFFCSELLSALIDESIEVLQNKVHDSAFSAESAKILEIIKRNKRISKSQLCRKTQHLSTKERQGLIDNLIEAELIEYDFEQPIGGTNGHLRNKKSLVYKMREG